MLTVLAVVLVALAVLNAVCTAWASALDAPAVRGARPPARRHPAASQRRGALCPRRRPLAALPGALLGIGLFAVANGAGTVTRSRRFFPSAALMGTLAAVAGLAAIPARLTARQPAVAILRAEQA